MAPFWREKSIGSHFRPKKKKSSKGEHMMENQDASKGPRHGPTQCP